MQPNIDPIIGELVRSLASSWLRHDHDEDVFPQLARDALADARLAEHLDGPAILRHALAAQASPRALHGAPGVVSLHRAPHFDVFAHVWHDDFAQAHDHDWFGAFVIVEGCALHVRHRFERCERVCDALSLGSLALDGAARVEAGDVVAVAPGPAFIHGVSHLAAQGVTISVRSRSTRGRCMTYFRPGVALAMDDRDIELECRLQALRLAAGFGEARLAECVELLLGVCDRRTAMFVLIELSRRGWALPEQAEAILHERFGAGILPLLAAADDVALVEHVTELRGRSSSPALRALFAALFVGERREDVLELLALARGDIHDAADPWQAIGRALVELLVVPSPGTPIPDAFVPAFAAIARGRPLPAIFDELASASPSDGMLEFIASAHAAIHAAPLYRPLFR